jgi:hypothetical protein
MIGSREIHFLILGTFTFLIALGGPKHPLNKYDFQEPSITKPDYRNFYGISWRSNPHENLTYAKQMKYDYVFYQKGMENDTLSNGMYFYLETPEYFTYDINLDVNKKYSDKEISFYENYCTLKNSSNPFPYNIATGWFFTKTTFNPILDFQQQKVISYSIDSIINLIKKIVTQNPNFHFGGLAWDVPNLSGDFWNSIQPPGNQITLKTWTGGDFGIENLHVKHDYSTYSEGHVQYYKQIYSRIRHQYPNAKFIMEPYYIYEDWISQIMNRPDAKLIMPDLLSQEGPGTEFVNDSRIYANSLITKDRVASTTPNMFSEEDNRTVAAQAAINGAWFSWYGRFGGTGDMPDYQSISEVPPRLKLIRVLPNYENINQTPLKQRTWDGTTYKSGNAYASPKAIGVLQPGTSKYFMVLMASDGEIPIPVDKTIKSISRTNNLFLETGDGSADLIIKDGRAKLNGSFGINKAYILNFKK